MFVRSITVRRVGDYGGYGKVDPTKPFEVSIAVEGRHGEIKLDVSPEISRRIVEIIAEEVAIAGRATAEAMTADVLTVVALTPPEPAADA